MAYIVIAGDVHGAIGLFYEQALRLQDELKEPIEAILQVGDLQVYSEESYVDKADTVCFTTESNVIKLPLSSKAVNV